jgi:GT2 family glycosyltransferase
LTVITQENSGSAGGQHTGIKTAYERGHDWIWCMDDDCLLSEDALFELSKYLQANTVLNCLVLSKTDSSKLAFGLYDMTEKVFFDKYSETKEKIFVDYASLFNGTLLPSELIKNIGLPIEELFIKGDEIEYFHRIKKCGFLTKTVPSSLIYHPAPNLKIIKTFLFNHRFEHLDSIRRYYRARNFIYNYKLYKNFSLKTFTKFLLLDIYGIIVYQKSIHILLSNMKGLMRGMFVKYEIKFPAMS